MSSWIFVLRVVKRGGRPYKGALYSHYVSVSHPAQSIGSATRGVPDSITRQTLPRAESVAILSCIRLAFVHDAFLLSSDHSAVYYHSL